MTVYQFPYPASADRRDVALTVAAAVAGAGGRLLTSVAFSDDHTAIFHATLTAQGEAAVAAAVAATSADPNAAFRRREALAAQFGPSTVSALRQWAADARAVTATGQQAQTATILNTMLPRFATLFDRVADKIEKDELL